MLLDEVKASPIHGRGVFTTRNVKKGEKLCMYGGKRVARKDSDPLSPYKYALSKTEVLEGDPNPQNKIMVAQLINDACSIEIDEKDSFLTVLTKFCRYLAITAKCGNVDFVKGKEVVCIALKDIPIGTELLVPYGIPYWVSINKIGPFHNGRLALVYYLTTMAKFTQQHDILTRHKEGEFVLMTCVRTLKNDPQRLAEMLERDRKECRSIIAQSNLELL